MVVNGFSRLRHVDPPFSSRAGMGYDGLINYEKHIKGRFTVIWVLRFNPSMKSICKRNDVFLRTSCLKSLSKIYVNRLVQLLAFI